MPNITTCTSCGKCYEESSEERANEPVRECASCYRMEAEHGADRPSEEEYQAALAGAEKALGAN